MNQIKTPMTPKAAARIQSATGKLSNGQVALAVTSHCDDSDDWEWDWD